jgi:hypothetical protein
MTLLAHRTPTPVAEDADRNPRALRTRWRSVRAWAYRRSVNRKLGRTHTVQAIATEGEFAATAAADDGEQLTFH